MRVGTILLLATCSLAGFQFGCDRNDKGSGDSHAAGAPTDAGSSDARLANNVSEGGTGNGPTTIGTGATNGVVGSEARQLIGGPGNTESGAGTTTQPAHYAQ